jgi:excinuclease UvrABC nuclease subunit
MNSEIEIVAAQVRNIYRQQRSYLAGKPDHVVNDLHHRCQEAAHDENFSTRTAAEINRAACLMELETRKGKA